METVLEFCAVPVIGLAILVGVVMALWYWPTPFEKYQRTPHPWDGETDDRPEA